MGFRVLGVIEAVHDGGAVAIASARQRTILAALLVRAGERVTFDALVHALWGDRPPPDARGTMQAHVSRLRRVLTSAAAADSLRSAPGGYVMVLGPRELDAALFEHLVAAARAVAAEDPAAAVAGFDEALALWRGPAYAEVAEQDFARAESARLDELRRVAVDDRADAELALGRHAELISELEATVARHPLRERPCAQLMLARYRDGRIGESLQACRELRTRLADELGLDPSPRVQQLEADILRGAAHLDLPTGSTSVHTDRQVALTSFVGREAALDGLAALLDRARIVTLTGTGGAGKTRLATELAHRVADRFPDGVRVVELAALGDPHAVTDAVAGSLGITRQGSTPLLDTLVAALRPRRTLLVVDNCEHLLPDVAVLVDRVARECPQLVVVATSRERLAIRGEHLWPVAPLEVPTEDAASGATSALLQVPAVRLFCDRATAADPAFRLETTDRPAVVRICRRLDGLPLAIELAAARIRALAPAELALRLGARFNLLATGPRGDTDRHRTLRATIDWSYGLLDPAEATLFDQLSVFTGGFDLAAAEAICAGTAGGQDVAELLVSLVDKSMVTAAPIGTTTRYRLLETLRDYAAERLAGRGDTGERGRAYAQYYVQLAENADRDVCARDEARGVALLDRELDNFRAAHQWSVAHQDADLALRLSAALHFYAVHRLRDEVLGWAAVAAALPTAAGHALRATACASAGFGAAHRGERAEAARLAAEGAASANDSAARADVGETLAVIAIYEGRLADCRRHAREAVHSSQSAGDAYRAQWSSHVEALAAVYARDPDAPAMVDSVHAGAVALGNPSHLAWAWYLRGEAILDADPDQAVAALERAVELAGSVRNHFVRGVALVSSGSARGRSADPWGAVGAFRAIIDHWRRAGDWTHQWTTLRNLVDLLVRLEIDEPAALILGAASRSTSAPPVYGVGADRLARAEELMQSRLGVDRFRAAVERGSTTSDDDLVVLMLDELDQLGARTAPAAGRGHLPSPPTAPRSPAER